MTPTATTAGRMPQNKDRPAQPRLPPAFRPASVTVLTLALQRGGRSSYRMAAGSSTLSKQSIDTALGALAALRSSPTSPETVAHLRKALKHRINYVASKAAALVAELGARTLVPDLIDAFDHFLQNPIKSDAQCRAKSAIAKALMDLGHDDPGVYLRGMSHVQLEPVWGGREDTAATLRGTCALALVNCRLDPVSIEKRLVDLLSDAEKTVRIDALRAISQFPDAPLLLRVKAIAGDPFPEVTGQCFASLLDISSDDVDFVARFLDTQHGDVCFEAIAALGACRKAQGIAALIACWREQLNPELRAAILTSLGASRDATAYEFLLSLMANASFETASAAMTSLAKSHFIPDIRRRAAAVVESRSDTRLTAAFEQAFVEPS
jgi:HEAT repeat protein